MKMKDYGWVWEGQGLDPGVYPSIFGVGEGCSYFGLERACYMFHPNSDFAMEKLADLEEVVCDISKWKWRRTPDGGTANWADSSVESVEREARNVSQLSKRHPNVSGALHDDMKGLMVRENCEPSRYGKICEALKGQNPKLKLWVVVYTRELDKSYWQDFAPYMDVVNLWVWGYENLPRLDADLQICRQIFEDKPVNIGCYLRDYPSQSPIPMDHLKSQWELVLDKLEKGEIAGYSILGTVLIDGHQDQAQWIRDFIARNS